jgi:hypothetical protein
MKILRVLANKRGSSVIMVLVAMAFISILGTILMFSSFTGYQIKAAQARGGESFYNAETALDEIRAGVQSIVTDCIAKAHTAVLRAYTHDMDIESAFSDNFVTQLKLWVNADEQQFILPRIEDGYFTYNSEVLEGFISGDSITAAFSGEVDADLINGIITLKGVTIMHLSSHGFQSRVSSDIVIAVPNFSFIRSSYTISGIPEFALIADTELYPLHSAVITGNAYAGMVNTNIVNLSISNGTLISSGNINVNNGGSFTVNPNAALWANRIIVGDNSSTVSLTGEAYIADDLVLNAENANALLSGSYHGFGLSLTNAGQSSSILINGVNSRLDMSGLNTLFLAGHSFINTQNFTIDGITGVDIVTGQSLTVKSDQLAYLIAPDAVGGVRTNPIIFSGSEPDYDIELNTVLWTIDGVQRRLGDYIAGVRPVYRPVPGSGGQMLLYLFMQFPDRDSANEYFRDYFTHNSEEIEHYVDIYLDLFAPAPDTRSSGVYYTVSGDNRLDIGNPFDSAALTTPAMRLGNMYRNLSSTLSANLQAAANVTPYTYIVNEQAVAALTDNFTVFKNGDGDIVSVIIKGDTTIGEIFDRPYHGGINLILATGDVTVDREFSGLIISGGKIELRNDVTATPQELIPSMGARNDDSKMFNDFLNQKIVGDSDVSSGGSIYSWDMSALVFYENWVKN